MESFLLHKIFYKINYDYLEYCALMNLPLISCMLTDRVQALFSTIYPALEGEDSVGRKSHFLLLHAIKEEGRTWNEEGGRECQSPAYMPCHTCGFFSLWVEMDWLKWRVCACLDVLDNATIFTKKSVDIWLCCILNNMLYVGLIILLNLQKY